MTARVVLLRCVAVAALAAPPLLTLAPSSSAQGPVAVGWWNLAHQVVAPPAPPGVGDGDLLLQGGGAAPSAYAAVRFVLAPDVTVGVLTLPVDPDGAPSRADAVTVCRAGSAWEPVENGAYSDAPAPDCAVRLPAVASPDGTALVVADVARLVRGGSLDLVVLPGPADRVVLLAPGSGALTGQPVRPVETPTPPVGAGTPPAAGPAPAVEEAPVTARPLEPPPPPTGGVALAPFAPGPAAVADPAPLLPADGSTAEAVAPPPPRPEGPTALPPAVAAPRLVEAAAVDDTRTRVLVVLEALLVLAFFGLLGWGPFARLQALTGEAPVAARTSRGVGRFARERAGTPPSL